MLDHDKVFQLGEVLGVRCILLRLLIVDLSDEPALLDVGVVVEGVVPVLSLHKEPLHEVRVDAVVKQVPHQVTENVDLPGAVGEAEDPLVLGANRHEILDGRGGAPLRHGAEELPALRKPNRIVTILRILWSCKFCQYSPKETKNTLLFLEDFYMIKKNMFDLSICV